MPKMTTHQDYVTSLLALLASTKNGKLPTEEELQETLEMAYRFADTCMETNQKAKKK